MPLPRIYHVSLTYQKSGFDEATDLDFSRARNGAFGIVPGFLAVYFWRFHFLAYWW